MRTRIIADAVERMSATPGIESCALVQGDSGLVWHACGRTAGAEHLWEAAVDYWRLHRRQQEHFRQLGPLGAAVMYHASGVLAVVPCTDEAELMVVCVGAHAGVDWIHWQRQARALGPLIRAH